MIQFIERLLNLYRGDLRRGGLLFSYLFLIIASYVVGKVARDALFLDRFQAVQLPYADIAIALLVGLVVAVYVRINALVITLQPEEGFDLHFEVKAPGQPPSLQTHKLHFRYAEVFAPLPDAYETLLGDIMTGDQTLFVRDDEVEASWRLYTPLLAERGPVQPYPAGSWGPPEAERLVRPPRG